MNSRLTAKSFVVVTVLTLIIMSVVYVALTSWSFLLISIATGLVAAFIAITSPQDAQSWMDDLRKITEALLSFFDTKVIEKNEVKSETKP